MIGYDRPLAPPQVFNTQKISDYLTEHRAVYAKGQRVKSSDFYKSVWQNNILRTTLWEAQSKKCCYCEKILELKRESDVEHFRPKAMISGVPEHPGYWWLAYDWTNFLYSCKHCNQEYKANKFKLVSEDQRASTETHDLTRENPSLINPFDEDPSDFLAYDRQGDFIYITGRPGDENRRGEYTIETCGLNRLEIVRRRVKVWKSFKLAVQQYIAARASQNVELKNEAIDTILELAAPNSPDAGMARYFLAQYGLEGLLE